MKKAVQWTLLALWLFLMLAIGCGSPYVEVVPSGESNQVSPTLHPPAIYQPPLDEYDERPNRIRSV